LKNKPVSKLSVFLKGVAMGIADVIPGVSGGTIALISGIYEELIDSIDNLNLTSLLVLKKEGFSEFWNKINGRFLLPLILGIGSSIVFFSGIIHDLLIEYPIPVWAFFFGLICGSIVLLLKQNKPNSITSITLLISGFVLAYSITQITPSGDEVSLPYLFFCSMIAIIAMILPGISGSFIYILLGAYETVIHTSKNSILALINFEWDNFVLIYSRLLVIGLGIIVGLKSFTKILKWLFDKHKQGTLMLLIGFMGGALPKIWPWQKKNGGQTEFTSPWNYEGDPQVVIAVILMIIGFLFLYFLERNSSKKTDAT
jgi:putative membrane protein